MSGSVQTWKIGFNWNVVDSLRLRGTTSIDIRAPTLNDLFQPATLLQNVFTDLHVPDPTKSQAPNPQFMPARPPSAARAIPTWCRKCARTYTVGAVWTPGFISGLTMSLDYYRIHMANAIGQIAPSTTIQALCEASGGTSIYCANYQRPLPFSDHSHREFRDHGSSPSISTPPRPRTEGWDFETNYGWQMSDLVAAWKGSWNARLLATYQPVINKSVLFSGRALDTRPDPSTRITAFLNYTLNDWSLGLEDSWVSGFSQVAGPVTRDHQQLGQSPCECLESGGPEHHPQLRR